MKLLRDESGQSLVLFAAFMGILALGFLAFALDAGSLFRQKRLAQAAADGAALAAAEEIPNGITAEQNAANAIAKLNGFDTTLATNPATVTLSTPSSGNFTGTSYVQAKVSQPIKTVFLGAFRSGMATMPVSAISIAGGGQSSQTCLCLNASSGQNLYMSNGAKISAPSCGIVTDSSASNAIGMIGGSTVDALTLGTISSTWNTSANIYGGASISGSTTIVQGISSKCSGTMPPAPTYSTCLADPGGTSSSFTAGPSSASGTVCYTGLTVGANNTKDTLNPGTYVISDGYLHFESGYGGKSNLGGNGVFFYLTGTASLVIDNGANVNLVSGGSTMSGGGTAPTVGVYNGILFYQVASDTAAMTVQGGATTYMNGSFYAPGAAITLGNGSGSTVKGNMVATTLTMSGGGTLTAIASSNQGSLTYGSPKLVQ